MDIDWNGLKPILCAHAEDNSSNLAALEKCRKAHESSLAMIEQADAVLFSFVPQGEQDKWGEAISEQFLEWRKGPAPVMTAFFEKVCLYFDIDEQNPLFEGALLAAVMAEIPNGQTYHNNHHFREVVMILMRMCVTYNGMTLQQDVRLTADQILLLFIAACLHDFGHDGKDNMVDGEYVPARMEEKSIDLAMPVLVDADCPAAYLDMLSLLIICTDATNHGMGPSPAAIARDILTMHVQKDIVIEDLDPFFQPLVDDYKAALMAVMLCEADIAPSSGLSYMFSKKMTVAIARESSALEPTAATLHGFMETICQGRYLTAAARYLMAENFTSISLQASEDSKNNVMYG